MVVPAKKNLVFTSGNGDKVEISKRRPPSSTKVPRVWATFNLVVSIHVPGITSFGMFQIVLKKNVAEPYQETGSSQILQDRQSA